MSSRSGSSPASAAGWSRRTRCCVATSAVRNLVREGKTRQLRNAMQMGIASGNQTLEMSLNALVSAGVITLEDAIATAFVPQDIAGSGITGLVEQAAAGA